MIGFDENRANTLLVDGSGRLAGRGRGADPRPRGQARHAERAARAPCGSRRDDTLAIGDGANDIPMIEAAGLGVAYHAKPAVADAAAARIDHGDLTALLYAQGYARAEFVAP